MFSRINTQLAYVLLLAIGLIAAPQHGFGARLDAVGSVVSLLPVWPERLTDQQARQKRDEPEGSGIAITGDGWIATAAHVVAPAEAVYVRIADGRVFPAKQWHTDTASDIGLVQIDHSLPPFSFGPSAIVGDPVCAIGNPFGLGLSLSCGVVSARQVSGIGFNAIEDFIQTDAAVNPGMSGGALIDEKGALVGMLAAIFTKSGDGDVGVNFAISTDLLQRVIEPLRRQGHVTWGRPGMALGPLGRSLRRTVTGAQITRIQPRGAADRAGLQIGDVITAAGGRRVKRASDVITALHLQPPRNPVTLHILRGGVRHHIPLALQ